MSSVSEIPQLPELPPTWRWSTMDQACLKIQDGTHFSPKNQHAHGKYRYITAKNVKPSGLDLSDVSYLSEADHRVIYKRCDPQKGDVLLVKDGVNTGDAALNTLNEEFSLLSSVCLLRPRSDLISSPFLRYFILSPVGYRLLTGQMTGTAIKRIVLRRIKDSPVPIAPLSEQQRIVAEIEKQFSRLDEAVASLKRAKANLKRYKAAVIKAAVEGKLTEEWRKQHPDVEPASKLVERILAERRSKWSGKGKYSEPEQPDIASLPKLPDGWIWACLEAVAALKGGITVDKNRKSSSARKIPYLRVANVQRGYLDLSEIKEIDAPEADIRDLRLVSGDILFNEGGDRDKLGRGWVWEGQLSECIHQNHVFRARLYLAEVSPKLVSWWGNSFGKTYFLREGKQTTNLASINITKLSAFPIPLPSTAEQQQIVAEVERRLSVIDELEAAVEANLTRTDRLRQSVLQQAFSGGLLSYVSSGRDSKTSTGTFMGATSNRGGAT